MKFGVTNFLTKDKKVVEGPLLISPKCFEDDRRLSFRKKGN